jgi:ribosomal protein S20
MLNHAPMYCYRFHSQCRLVNFWENDRISFFSKKVIDKANQYCYFFCRNLVSNSLVNSKASLKSIKQTSKRMVRNRMIISRLRTRFKKVMSPAKKNSSAVREAAIEYVSYLDKAAKACVIHPNKASCHKGMMNKSRAFGKESECWILFGQSERYYLAWKESTMGIFNKICFSFIL